MGSEGGREGARKRRGEEKEEKGRGERGRRK